MKSNLTQGIIEGLALAALIGTVYLVFGVFVPAVFGV